MTDSTMLREIVLLLLAAVVAVPVAHRLKISPVLGYLAAGILIGPHALGLLPDIEEVRGLADFGVVFLLFAVGLELSVERLRVMRRLVFGLGGAQILCTSAAFGAIGLLAGLGVEAALVVGGALALSSTAIVLQLLAERGEVTSRAGRAAIAVLLAQDLAVVPMLTLIPLLGGDGESLWGALGLAALKAAGALAAIMVVGPAILRPLLRLVARTHNTELFAAVTLLAVLATAWATGLVGLSLPLGAFLAGLILADTEFRHQVAAEIQSFRGLLLGLFFMTVGMTIDGGIVLADAPLVAAIVLGLVAFKAGLLALLARGFGLPLGTALHVGLLLGEGGEFAFVLCALAASGGVLAPEVAQLLVVCIALSMVLTPGLAALGRLAERRVNWPAAEPLRLEAETRDLAGHVVILGYGRVGRTVAAMLQRAEIPYIALDLDIGAVERARSMGRPVFYGDAGRPEVLRSCGLTRARAMVVTLDRSGAAERAVELAHRLRPDLPVLARGRDHGHAELLRGLGAAEVVMEMTEVSLALGGKALAAAALPPQAIDAAVSAMREAGAEFSAPASTRR